MQVQQVRLGTAKAKAGEHQVYGTRFYGEGDKLLLSVILHGPAGEYAPGAVDAWAALRAKYGEAFPLDK
jgi:hypothetical protein